MAQHTFGCDTTRCSMSHMDQQERFQYKTVGKYQVGRVIGTGEFCEVRLARDSTNNRVVAIKFIPKAAIENGRLTLDQLDREIDCMDLAQSPYALVKLDFLVSERFYYLVLEYCPGGSLFNTVGAGQTRGDEKAARIVFRRIVECVAHLHSQGVVHRDIKPENFLIKESGEFVISDFGYATQVLEPNAPETLACGTSHYMAPEVLTETYLPFPVDVWSCGVILYILLAGKMPFYGNDPDEVFSKIERGQYKPLDGECSAGAVDLVQRMLVVEPELRAPLDEVQRHPWLTET